MPYWISRLPLSCGEYRPVNKINGLKQKYLLKKAMQGILPKELIWRGKAGFGAPVRAWLRDDLLGMEAIPAF